MSNKPLIHFAHATGMPVPVYRKMLDALREHYDVIHLPTWLGIDERYPIDNHWQSLSYQVRDSIIEQAQGRKVIGLGHSLGAVTTFLVSLQQPELFERVILLDPSLILGKASLQVEYAKHFDAELLDKITPAHLSIKRREHWENRTQAGESLRPKGFYQDFDEDCFADYLTHALRDDHQRGGVTLTIPREAEVAIFRTNPSYWWWHQPQVQVPTTLLMGRESIFTQRGFPQIAEQAFGVNYQLIDGGHMFPLERPLAVADWVHQLLTSEN